MSGSSRQKIKHNKFISQDGKCYWCGCQMTLDKPKKRHLPNNYATFEHLVDRYDKPDRTHDRQIVVLACNRCNKKRNDDKQKNLPLLEYWYRQWYGGNGFSRISSNLKYLF